MFYRRKLLLALLEVFNGNLKNTDCEKLLFNACKMTGKNHYDFFPYRFGPFSFVSYYDKKRLTELRLLKATDDFQLRTSRSFLKELEFADQAALFRLKASGLRGSRLVRQTYREFPQFAARSEIVATLFSPEELKQIRSAWNTSRKSLVFTIGYEGLTIDGFLNKLISNNVMAVLDVRNNPRSMKFGFSKKGFSRCIANAGMKYMHLPELGIPSALRKELGTGMSRKSLFHTYATELLPKQELGKMQLLKSIARYHRIAVVCFEADHRLCHRHSLIEQLKKERTLLEHVIHL